MISEHVLMGGSVMVLCLMGLAYERWLLENSAYGQRLVRWFGHGKAPAIFKAMMLAGLVFGGLLAGGIVRPLKW